MRLRRTKKLHGISVVQGITPEECIRFALHDWRKKAKKLELLYELFLLYKITLENDKIKYLIADIVPYKSPRMDNYMKRRVECISEEPLKKI